MNKINSLVNRIADWLETRCLTLHTDKVKRSVENATAAFRTVLTQLQQAEVDGNTSAAELQRSAKAQLEAAAICMAEADKAGRVSRRIQELLEA